MSPIRHMTRREWLIAFWAVVIVAAVVSTGALISARKANNTAARSEKGFCIAIKLIESGAIADNTIATRSSTPEDVKSVRKQQARGSLFFAIQLRDIVHCPQPSESVRNLYKSFNIKESKNHDS